MQASRAEAVCVASMRENPQKRHARALGRKGVVNVVAKVDGLPGRYAIEQQTQPLGVWLSLRHIVHGDHAPEKMMRFSAVQRVVQFLGACGP